MDTEATDTVDSAVMATADSAVMAMAVSAAMVMGDLAAMAMAVSAEATTAGEVSEKAESVTDHRTFTSYGQRQRTLRPLDNQNFSRKYVSKYHDILTQPLQCFDDM